MHTVQSAATELEATPHFQVSLHLCVQTLLPSCMHMSASCLLTYTDDLVGRAVVPKVPSWVYVRIHVCTCGGVCINCICQPEVQSLSGILESKG